MTDTFFEQIHTAAPDQPYIDTDRQNLTYTSHYHNEIELIPVIRGSLAYSVKLIEIGKIYFADLRYRWVRRDLCGCGYL